MEFDDIRAFVAVAESRSVSRAARELHLTQPAVTRRVQRLETSLGVALCDRRRRPFVLTEAGPRGPPPRPRRAPPGGGGPPPRGRETPPPPPRGAGGPARSP